MTDPLESEIESKVCHYARQRYNILGYKFTSPNRRSVPDRLFLGPGGIHFFIEFKRLGGKPTKSQKREIDRLRGFGHHVHICDDVDRGKAIIDLEASGTATPISEESHSPHIGQPARDVVVGYGIGQDDSSPDNHSGEDGPG